MDSHRFQILSIDGGGIRGVFAASILAAIEEDCRTSIVDHFDLIAGTSTGGIIAIALGLGLHPRQIVEFYVKHGTTIFRPSVIAPLAHLFQSKYCEGDLESALKTCLGNRLFGESSRRLVIPSYNLDENDVYVFRTPHLEHLRRDFRVPAWKVAMATTAAPTYFAAFRGVDGLRLVDGGVWANNPAMVALGEAVGPLGLEQSDIALLSIGTVSGMKRFSNRLDRGGTLSWAPEAAPLIIDASSIGVNNQVQFLLSPERYMRINATAPAKICRSTMLQRLMT